MQRGLLHSKVVSTRVDAARFATDCGASDTTGCQFGYEQSDVKLIFSGGKFGDGRCPKLPVGTLLAIIVKFDRPQPLENFRLKNRKEVLFDPSNPPSRGYKGYYYPHEGFYY